MLHLPAAKRDKHGPRSYETIVGRKKRNRQQGNAGASPPVAAQPRGSLRVTPGRTRVHASTWWVWLLLIAGLLVVGGIRPLMAKLAQLPPAPQVAIGSVADALPAELVRSEHLIRDVHEHIQSLEYAPIYLEMMDELGIKSMCLMGSSKFTLTLNEKYGFTQYDENDEELLKIVKAYPGRFEAWVTLNPVDPDKLSKLQDYVARGATGVKLYTGHGYVTSSGAYMFHPVAMDDPGMLPVYAWCQENYVPVCIHVNPFAGKKGFAEEFVAVLTRFPDLKVVCPHFVLSTIQSSRLREFLNTFPNLYTDVSFGDAYVGDGLKRISKSPKKYQKIFTDYPDRIMFAADLVLTPGATKTRQWVREQLTAYLDLLTKRTYTTPIIPNVELNGLNLPANIVERVLYKNYEDFVAKRPKGTVISRTIDWKSMNVTPTGRMPGQAFPPAKKVKGESE